MEYTKQDPIELWVMTRFAIAREMCLHQAENIILHGHGAIKCN